MIFKKRICFRNKNVTQKDKTNNIGKKLKYLLLHFDDKLTGSA